MKEYADCLYKKDGWAITWIIYVDEQAESNASFHDKPHLSKSDNYQEFWRQQSLRKRINFRD